MSESKPREVPEIVIDPDDWAKAEEEVDISYYESGAYYDTDLEDWRERRLPELIALYFLD